MSKIVKMAFGSCVYGTSTPDSDQDFKGVFIPEAKDIILQRAPATESFHSNIQKNTKNTKDDVDIELFSLQKFFHLLHQGQTVAFDMLFTPKQFISETSDQWQYIQNNKEKFLHKKISSFVGYCKAQSEKYSLRGSRMTALKIVIDHLSQFNVHSLLGNVVSPNTFDNEFINIVYGPVTHSDLGPSQMVFLDVCGKKAGFTSNIKFALDMFKHTLSEYGARAQQAADNKGIDLKAQYHAVRIAREAEELLLTGNITFPRPEAPLLLQIRKGELEPSYVSGIIEEGMVRIIEAQDKSSLPLESDSKFAEKFVMESYLGQIKTLVEADELELEHAFYKATKAFGW